MKAVILVGGEGTRLRPLTYSTTKAMMPILNKPFLEHLVLYLKSHGVEDIILALCYLPDRIRGHFGDGGELGVKLTYVVENSPLGTAGAVKNARSYLDEAFFVFNGDIFTDLDLSDMARFHQEKGALATIALTPVEDPSAYGVVETDDLGTVRRFVEKPRREEATSNMINAGTYVLSPDALRYIPPDAHFMFEHHLFPLLLERGELLYSYPSRGYWIDMGTPEKYLQLHRDLLAGKSTMVNLNDIEKGGAFIDPAASINGSVMIGEGCAIGRGARIEGPVAMGAGCEIGQDTVVEDSVLWKNVRLGGHVVLRSSIVGGGCLIGDDVAATGSVIGNGAVIASGTRLEPNTRISPGSKVDNSPE